MFSFGASNNQQQQQPQQQQQSVFGSAPAGNIAGSAFGAPAPTVGAFGSTAGSAFGSAPGSSAFGGGAFGSQQQQQPQAISTSGGLFGQPTSTMGSGMGGFGAAAAPGGFGAQSAASLGPTSNTSNNGTGNPMYSTTTERESAVSSQTYHSISAMMNYRNWSWEELRLRDYELGKKYPGAASTATAGAFGSGGLNVSSNAPSTGGGLFGASSSTPFGQSSSGFGAQPSTAAAGGFGFGGAAQTSTPFGQPQAPATTGGFGSGGSAFGQPKPTTGFGSAFGAPSTAPTSTFGTGTSSFGAQPTTTTGFGAPSSLAATMSTGFGQQQSAGGFGGGFGQQPSSGGFGSSFGGATTSFGQQQQQQSGTAPGAFGQQTSTSGGFGSAATSGGLFGKPATTGFGSTSTTFGQPTATSAFGAGGATGFGGATPSTGFGAAQPATSAFGAPAPTTTFGQAPSTSTTGFGSAFGAPAAPAQPKPFSFGGAAPSAPGAFGAPSAAPGTSAPFGQPQQQSLTQQSSLFPSAQTGFGQAAQTGYTPTTTASTGLFGQQQSTATTAGTGGLFGGQAAAKPAFNFGAGAVTTASMPSAGTGLFGASSSATQPSSLGGGLFGKPAAPMTSSLFGAPSGSEAQKSSLFAPTTGAAGTSLFQPTQPTVGGPSLTASIDSSAYGNIAELKPLETGVSVASKPALPAAAEKKPVVIPQYRFFDTPKSEKIRFKGVSSAIGGAKIMPTMTPAKPIIGKSEPMYSTDMFVAKKSIKKLEIAPQAQQQESSTAGGLTALSTMSQRKSSSTTRTSTSPERFSFVKPATVEKKDLHVTFDDIPTPAKKLDFRGVEDTPLHALPPRLERKIAPTVQELNGKSISSSFEISTLPNESTQENINPDYYSIPTLPELLRMPKAQLKNLRLEVGRKGVGRVVWESCDLSLFPDLKSLYGDIVKFEDRVCIVYETSAIAKHPVGEGLNRTATIYLYTCYPTDKTTRKVVKDREGNNARIVDAFIDKLRRVNETKFLGYKIEDEGLWWFTVAHFSRYGIEDTDVEDELPLDKVAAAQPSLMENNDSANFIIQQTPVFADKLITDLGLETRRVSKMRRHFPSYSKERSSRKKVDRPAEFDELPAQMPRLEYNFSSNASQEEPALVQAPVPSPKVRSSPARPITGHAQDRFLAPVPDMHVSSPVKNFVSQTRPAKDRGLELVKKYLKDRKQTTRAVDGSTKQIKDAKLPADYKVSDNSASWACIGGSSHLVEARESKIKIEKLICGVKQKSFYESYLNLILERSSFSEFENVLPFVELKSLSFRDLMSSPVADGDGFPEFQHNFWNLCSVLFDNLPGDSENADNSVIIEDSYVAEQRRKDLLSLWLEDVIQCEIEPKLKQCSGEPGKLLFHLLLCRNIKDALVIAEKNKDFYLASIISQLSKTSGANLSYTGVGGLDPEIRNLIYATLQQYDGTDCDTFPVWYRRIYTLLASDLDTLFKDLKADGYNLSWLQCFALYFWYWSTGNNPIIDSLQAYEIDYNADDGHSGVAFPRPWWDANGQTKGAVDAYFHVLKLYTDPEYDIENVLQHPTSLMPALFSESKPAGTHVIMWVFWRIATSKSIGLKDADVMDVDMTARSLHSEKSFAIINETGVTVMPKQGPVSYLSDDLCESFVFELGQQGLWKWAVFIALHIGNVEKKEQLIGRLIVKNIDYASDDVSFAKLDWTFPQNLFSDFAFSPERKLNNNDSSFLEAKLKIPKPIIYNAKAIKAKYNQDDLSEACFRICAHDFAAAHDLILYSLLPKIYLKGKKDTVKQLCNSLGDYIDMQPTGVKIFADYLQFDDNPIEQQSLGWSILNRVRSWQSKIESDDKRYESLVNNLDFRLSLERIASRIVDSLHKLITTRELGLISSLPLPLATKSNIITFVATKQIIKA